MSYASFSEELRKWWSFDDRQGHTHTWHSREDFIDGKMRELIDRETKPLDAKIERLLAAPKGAEIALARDGDIDGAMRCILGVKDAAPAERLPMAGPHAYVPSAEWDDDDDDDSEHDWLEEECGLMPDGQCAMAGTEHCDFCCPNRDSEDFCGSAAWHKKQKEHSR